jgi:hypothetical protein
MLSVRIDELSSCFHLKGKYMPTAMALNTNIQKKKSKSPVLIISSTFFSHSFDRCYGIFRA